jgi:hypothetical protein
MLSNFYVLLRFKQIHKKSSPSIAASDFRERTVATARQLDWSKALAVFTSLLSLLKKCTLAEHPGYRQSHIIITCKLGHHVLIVFERLTDL